MNKAPEPTVFGLLTLILIITLMVSIDVAIVAMLLMMAGIKFNLWVPIGIVVSQHVAREVARLISNGVS